MEFDILNFYDRLVERWETRVGLLMVIIIVTILYFFLVDYFELERLITNDLVRFLVIPAALDLTVFIYWLWKTNRFYVKTSDKITAGIIVIVDEGRDRAIISKIVRKVLATINRSKAFENVELRMLPINFCEHIEDVQKYHRNFYFMYDLIIRISVQSGHYQSIEKIIIERLSVTFRTKAVGHKKKVFYNAVDLIGDMDLQIASRNWEYLPSNSGNDKDKYLGNLKQIFIYYIGFYAIYADRYEDALKIMTAIYDPDRTRIPIAKREGNKHFLVLQPFNIAEARLATILVDLFFYSAIKSYNEADTEKALSNFIKLENLIKDHPNKFEQYINMARFSYEVGELDKAISYTELAKKFKPGSLEVLLNQGFFAILNDNLKGFCSIYSQLFQKRDEVSLMINWLDVLDFQLRQKEKLDNRGMYFDFSTSLINYVFVDSNRRDEFDAVVQSYSNQPEYACLFVLGGQILSTLDSRTTLNAKNKRNQAVMRKKRRKKKKRK